MDSELGEFENRCRTLSQHKMLCTGEPMLVPERDQWPDAIQSEADFSVLVSGAYKLWREAWKLDVGFLINSKGNSTEARKFDQLIYQLRTADQHTDNTEAVTRRADWTAAVCGGQSPASQDDWTSCGRALMAAFSAAVACLTALAAASRLKPEFRQAWQAKFSESVQAVVARVSADLNVYLPPSTRQYHERQVEKRWSKHKLRSGETAAQVMGSFAECSLVSDVRPLPCDYLDILDELQVLGTRDAVTALRLAHSVAEISLTTGDAYLKLVVSTWTTLRSGNSS
ncbi:hypothetical protein AB0E21_30415 [Streptomyces sp. NPDC047967]|uniref:hypothetical protein n=1 Tax=Streptomyces sp. NPDC047967 TaxID=3154924 RepID=UPI00340C53A7